MDKKLVLEISFVYGSFRPNFEANYLGNDRLGSNTKLKTVVFVQMPPLIQL